MPNKGIIRVSIDCHERAVKEVNCVGLTCSVCELESIELSLIWLYHFVNKLNAASSSISMPPIRIW